MTNVITINLEGRTPKSNSIEFVDAQMNGLRRTPFALIRYKENGTLTQYGLRLDLDKRSFLDHFDNKEQETFVKSAAPKIAEIVGQEMQSH